jgi:DNA-binding NarL/FixJ family response regulator
MPDGRPLTPIRIVIVDDYKDWRSFVRSLLQSRPEWQIVCEVSDGSEAVQKADKLRPDLIVLDIGLPKLNGIEAARRIRQVFPNSKIVFLTMDNSLYTVQAALATGALGYVHKASTGSELLPAIEAVLRGERFVSSGIGDNKLTETPEAKVAHRHELLFFSDDTVLLNSFTRIIAAALKADNAAIALVTKSHQESLRERLKAECVDVDSAIQQGTFILVDVAETLATLLVDGVLDSVRAFEGFSHLIEAASKAAKAEHPRVAICCQCKGSLWAEGNTDAAIQLEQCCNDLAETHEIDFLCAYPSSDSHDGKDEHEFQIITSEHSAVYSP